MFVRGGTAGASGVSAVAAMSWPRIWLQGAQSETGTNLDGVMMDVPAADVDGVRRGNPDLSAIISLVTARADTLEARGLRLIRTVGCNLAGPCLVRASGEHHREATRPFHPRGQLRGSQRDRVMNYPGGQRGP